VPIVPLVTAQVALCPCGQLVASDSQSWPPPPPPPRVESHLLAIASFHIYRCLLSRCKWAQHKWISRERIPFDPLELEL